MSELDLKILIGETLIKIEIIEDWLLIFYSNSGKKYAFVHEYQCCEIVTIEDIIGDLNDLIGVPILKAEKVTNSAPITDEDKRKYDEYSDGIVKWTFYKFSTIKGYVDIRWFGSSNGYYAIDVSFFYFDQDSRLFKYNPKSKKTIYT